MNSTRKVILARHGETELNRLGVVQGSGIDPALNEFGQAQAEALFQALDGQVDLIVSSGMVRARQTAQPFVATGLPYIEDARFQEICWGEHEGKVAEPWMRLEYKALMLSWDSGDYTAAHRGGESAAELAARLMDGWQALLQHGFGTALVVTHGRALRCLACSLAGLPLSEMNQFEHTNAGFYEVAVAADGTWTLNPEHRVAHLQSLLQTQNISS